MSSHPDLRAPTGVPRGPEQHRERVHDPERDALRIQLQRFEALAAADDPEQQAVRSGARDGALRARWCGGAAAAPGV
jgi:hypothetical protein